MAEQVEAAVQRHVQMGPRGAPAAAGEGGEQDPRAGDQFRVVVIDQQHPVETTRQRSHRLRPQDWGWCRCWCSNWGRGGGCRGQQQRQDHGLAALGVPPALPISVRATSAAMARIRSVER